MNQEIEFFLASDDPRLRKVAERITEIFNQCQYEMVTPLFRNSLVNNLSAVIANEQAKKLAADFVDANITRGTLTINVADGNVVSHTNKPTKP